MQTKTLRHRVLKGRYLSDKEDRDPIYTHDAIEAHGELRRRRRAAKRMRKAHGSLHARTPLYR